MKSDIYFNYEEIFLYKLYNILIIHLNNVFKKKIFVQAQIHGNFHYLLEDIAYHIICMWSVNVCKLEILKLNSWKLMWGALAPCVTSIGSNQNLILDFFFSFFLLFYLSIRVYGKKIIIYHKKQYIYYMHKTVQ